MPVQLSYPGVYVEEIPSGVRTITGVATSITAFVGRAQRGSTSEPVTVTSFGDFEREFGGLWKGSNLGFSVRDFFLNGGGTAQIVRLFRHHAGDKDNSALAADTLDLVAANEGEWGNQLRARVDHDTRDHDPDLNETATSLFNLYVRDGITGAVEEHRNVVVRTADHPRFVTKVLENESRLVRVSAPGAARPAKSVGTVDPGKTIWDDNTAPTNYIVTTGKATDGDPLSAAQFTGAGMEVNKQGLYRAGDDGPVQPARHPAVQGRRHRRPVCGDRRRHLLPEAARDPDRRSAADLGPDGEGGGRREHRLRLGARHQRAERRALLPAHPATQPAEGQPDRDLRPVRRGGRGHRPHRRDARCLEGAGRAGRDARPASRS